MAGGDVLLTVVVADGAPEEAAIIGKKEAFVCVKVQPISTDSGIDGIEQGFWLSQALGSDILRSSLA